MMGEGLPLFTLNCEQNPVQQNMQAAQHVLLATIMPPQIIPRFCSTIVRSRGLVLITPLYILALRPLASRVSGLQIPLSPTSCCFLELGTLVDIFLPPPRVRRSCRFWASWLAVNHLVSCIGPLLLEPQRPCHGTLQLRYKWIAPSLFPVLDQWSRLPCHSSLIPP